ncbi:MAG TPA: STAS domain-containing protein [Ilumatobacteraceae bacterium]|nr:STAS domain-containing protein [Ilumatobacteraceae bacterium]
MGTTEEFEYTVTRSGAQVTLAVRGELDAATGPSLSDAVTALSSDGVARLVIDLDHVTFVDSRGLSALLESYGAATERDTAFAVVNLQPAVRRLFRITGVDTLLLDGDAPS